MSIRTIQRSFSGGEISAEMIGRSDDTKYQSGLAACRNFIVKPQGPVENRAGFEFVRAAKESTTRVRLIPFTYSTTQTMVIEFGFNYCRFHTQGATLMDGDTPYEIASPYTEDDLFDIHFVQSADVLTLVHPNYAPRELRRLGALNWSLETIVFLPPIDPPTVTVTGNALGTQYTYYYVVTSMASDQITESEKSVVKSVVNNLYAVGGKNTIAWVAVAGASSYNVYKYYGGIFGYIGSSDSTSIFDENIIPDMSRSPPTYDTVFESAGNYPSAVGYFEQRRCFAGTLNKPQNVWMTKSGTESVMSYSLPVRDDDRIAFRVAANQANTIRHIVSLAQLLLLTSSAEWRITSQNSDAITPNTISVSPQSYVGASNVSPCIINNTLVYAAERGGHVREMAYSWQASGFLTGDLSLRAEHLFRGLSIVDMAYAKAPMPIVWCVSSNGALLGLTYIPEQQVGAWHRHDTAQDGVFESVAVVAEGTEDALYVIVRRTINDATVRHVERLAMRDFATQQDAFFVDCGLTYRGEAADTISGLAHLEGCKVSILADGATHPQRTVIDGTINLDQAASVVTVGLPITAELRTLPVAAQLDGALGQGRSKAVNQAWVRVYRSAGLWMGPDASRLVESKLRTSEPYGSPPALKTEEIAVLLPTGWMRDGQVVVQHRDPTPLTITSLALEVEVG